MSFFWRSSRSAEVNRTGDAAAVSKDSPHPSGGRMQGRCLRPQRKRATARRECERGKMAGEAFTLAGDTG
ncbi:hypothetical protein ELZ88_23810 (plasmid) [Salmonella enterica subsp. enterica serovar Karamoja]|uniref:Uncharacterized protein n=1 Tax=Salmonella enterica subsp. enterica serovar Karamoja TaxID=2500153 RepID=A0A3Q9MMZ2_SALET|nr:hypothetical protein ELZ88_23810 [Salmonella enterica subsp. enterica serovar Karamoja]